MNKNIWGDFQICISVPLSKIGTKTPLSKIPVLGDILFRMHIIMNEILDKFLLVGDKFIPEMHLRQPGFTYSTC